MARHLALTRAGNWAYLSRVKYLRTSRTGAGPNDIPRVAVNLKTLGRRRRNQGLAVRPDKFEFTREPFEIFEVYVEQEPHGGFHPPAGRRSM